VGLSTEGRRKCLAFNGLSVSKSAVIQARPYLSYYIYRAVVDVREENAEEKGRRKGFCRKHLYGNHHLSLRITLPPLPTLFTIHHYPKVRWEGSFERPNLNPAVVLSVTHHCQYPLESTLSSFVLLPRNMMVHIACTGETYII
jgi:hypothetical protein